MALQGSPHVKVEPSHWTAHRCGWTGAGTAPPAVRLPGGNRDDEGRPPGARGRHGRPARQPQRRHPAHRHGRRPDRL